MKRILDKSVAPRSSACNAVATAALASLLIVITWMAPARSSAEVHEAFRPADTSSPRATLQSFIDSCNQVHQQIQSDRFFDRASSIHHPMVERVLDCLDLSKLPAYERTEGGGEAAICLKEILDRVELPPIEEVPDAEAIRTAEEPILRYQIPGTRITIARVEEGPRRHEYLITSGTVGRSVEYYEDVKSLPYRTTGPRASEGFYEWYNSAPGHAMVGRVLDRLPAGVRQRYLGLAVWKWAGLLISLLLAVLLMGVCYKWHIRLSARYRDTALFRYCLTIFLPIIAMLVPLLYRHIAYEYLTARGTWLYIVSFASYITALLASLIVTSGIFSRIAAVIIASPQINPQGLDAQFIRIVARLLSIVAAVIVFLEGGQFLGIPVTTLLASAGVGGLAVALAAQDTVKSLFGTIVLLSDKPFRVGERIILGKYDGVVEDIGLRSTRVRLLTGHQATIPNDELARSDIENVGRRPHIRRVADIHIPLDTPRKKLEKAVAVIRAALDNHEGMDPQYPPRVFFFDFNPHAFVVRVIYWYNPPQYWDYLAFSEKVNFAVYRSFDEQGIQFSLPARITHTSIESKEKPVEVKLIDRTPAA